MSKQYEVDMNIDVSDLHPSGGLLMRQVPKEADPNNPDAEFDMRGFKERTGPEIFAMCCDAAINGANRNVSYQALKGFSKIRKVLNCASNSGSFELNKTDIVTIKNSLEAHNGWPNTQEMENVLDRIIERLDGAKLIESASAEDQGKNS